MLAGGVLFLGMLALGLAGGLRFISEQPMLIGLLVFLAGFWIFLWRQMPAAFLGFVGWTTKWKIAVMPLALALGLEIATREHLYAAYAVAVCLAIFWLYVDVLRFRRVLKSARSNSARSIGRGPNQ
jgi:hypothetical protein